MNSQRMLAGLVICLLLAGVAGGVEFHRLGKERAADQVLNILVEGTWHLDMETELLWLNYNTTIIGTDECYEYSSSVSRDNRSSGDGCQIGNYTKSGTAFSRPFPQSVKLVVSVVDECTNESVSKSYQLLTPTIIDDAKGNLRGLYQGNLSNMNESNIVSTVIALG